MRRMRYTTTPFPRIIITRTQGDEEPYTTSLFMSAVKMYFFYLEEAPEALVPFYSAPYSSAQMYTKEKAVAMTFADKGVEISMTFGVCLFLCSFNFDVHPAIMGKKLATDLFLITVCV